MEHSKAAVGQMVAVTGSADRAFWQGRKVFLTGHTGFKGGWCVLALASLGAEVHGYALAPETLGIYTTARLDGLMASSTIADVADAAHLASALAQSQAEIVLHMAAQPLVRASYVDPLETYRTNVMGTAHVLEAVRRCASVAAVVCVTSDKCYENREWVWGYREDELMGGYDPYSSSKGCAELLVSSWRRSFFATGAALASGRAGNVVGGGDWSSDRLIPDLIRAARQDRPAAIRNPAAVRPWQHALEAVFGYLALAERLTAPRGRDFATGWNFGPDSDAERTVGDVADTLGRHFVPDPALGARRKTLAPRGRLSEARFLEGAQPARLAPALGVRGHDARHGRMVSTRSRRRGHARGIPRAVRAIRGARARLTKGRRCDLGWPSRLLQPLLLSRSDTVQDRTRTRKVMPK